jgi:chromosomal replication initiation ATPase DnaA
MKSRDYLLGAHIAYPLHVIMADACHKYGITAEQFLGRQRRRALVLARHEAYYRAVDAGHSYMKIAREFNRDHTSILHGKRAHERRISINCPSPPPSLRGDSSQIVSA